MCLRPRQSRLLSGQLGQSGCLFETRKRARRTFPLRKAARIRVSTKLVEESFRNRRPFFPPIQRTKLRQSRASLLLYVKKLAQTRQV